MWGNCAFSLSVSSSPAPPGLNISQVDSEMMQIDSILKALNAGTFDQTSMQTIDQLTKKKPQVCFHLSKSSHQLDMLQEEKLPVVFVHSYKLGLGDNPINCQYYKINM